MTGDLDLNACKGLLATLHVGRLACCENDEPYIVPVTYVFAEDYIYGHANEGTKVGIMRRNPRVCFQVDDIEGLLHWRSVVVTGRFEELEGHDAHHALEILLSALTEVAAKAALLPDDETVHEASEHWIRLGPRKGVFYRIRPESVTGRYELP